MLHLRPLLFAGVFLFVVVDCVNLTPPWHSNEDAGRNDAAGGAPGAGGASGNGGAGANAGGSVAGGALSAGGIAGSGSDGQAAFGGAIGPDAGGSAGTNDGAADVPASPEAGDANQPELAADSADAPKDASIVVPTQGLVAYYPCERASGSTLSDLSGLKHDGVLKGATSFAGGQVGEGLLLTATNGVDGGAATGGYVVMPAGIVAGATEMTVATWFKLASTPSFARIFEFGTSTTTSLMYLTPRNGSGLPQFAIRMTADASETKQTLASTGSALATDVWYHIAVVLNAAGAALYLNGKLLASSNTITIKPADMGAMPVSWIGRSEYPDDPYFDGMIDEFRVYTRALSADEIAILFAAR